MYLWEAAVILGRDELDASAPAQTATGLQRDPVFAEKPTFRAPAGIKIEVPGVMDG